MYRKPGNMAPKIPKLMESRKEEVEKVVIDKLQQLVGGHGDLAVLAEYITVMLQSNRPKDQVEVELTAFLQEDGSKNFCAWLFDTLNVMCAEDERVERGEKVEKTSSRKESKGVQEDGKERKHRRHRSSRTEGGADGKLSSRALREAQRQELAPPRGLLQSAPAVAEEPALIDPFQGGRIDPYQGGRARSRSRSRGRQEWAPPEEQRSKVTLTPNVQYLRESYHKQVEVEEVPDDSRFYFRAALDNGYAMPPRRPPPPDHYPQARPLMVQDVQREAPRVRLTPISQLPPDPRYPMPPPSAPGYSMRPAYVPAARPEKKKFETKKWRVVKAPCVVRATEHLQSDEVSSLKEGEIVEQVCPEFTLRNGIIRIQIRHPRSPLFPMAIGWVTLDATSAGGPRFLEPGPDLVSRPQGNQILVSPQAKAPSSAPPARPPSRPLAPRTPFGYQNLTWRPPTAAKSPAAPSPAGNGTAAAVKG